MRLLTFALVAALLLTPTAASAQDWCDIHPDSPECGDLTEPVIPIIGPPCSSDFEWSCYSNHLFLPAIGAQNAWCVASFVLCLVGIKRNFIYCFFKD